MGVFASTPALNREIITAGFIFRYISLYLIISQEGHGDDKSTLLKHFIRMTGQRLMMMMMTKVLMMMMMMTIVLMMMMMTI